MSKKKIDETVTKARQAREKKAREKADAEATDQKPTVAEWMAAQGDEKAAIAAAMAAEETAHTDADAATESGTPDMKTRGLAVVPDAAPVAPTEAKEDLVVFAMRLTTAERDAIHAAAGPGKASKFVRQVAIAAARGDVDAVQRLIDARVK